MAETTSFHVRLPSKLHEQALHYAEKHGQSLNEYFRACVEHMINWENRDYDLPTAEIQRLNQLVDGTKALDEDVRALVDIVVSGFDSLLGLTKGDSHYLEEESGDLD